MGQGGDGLADRIGDAPAPFCGTCARQWRCGNPHRNSLPPFRKRYRSASAAPLAGLPQEFPRLWSTDRANAQPVSADAACRREAGRRQALCSKNFHCLEWLARPACGVGVSPLTHECERSSRLQDDAGCALVSS